MSAENSAHTVQVKVYFYDTDAGGRVHNLAYLRMVELARSELAEHLGWPLKEMMPPATVCPVVYHTEADYLKPAMLGDTLEIEGKITSIERVRMHMEFIVHRKGESDVLCRVRQVLVSVDLQTGRPRPSPEDWQKRFSSQ